ncbi:hypothetical protein L3Q82_000410 [Scortum barcoo]|uniref:Uncharacterized protein n=1 Tax=Scortum barcoo TaxID=214431 RepID=A0ACB8X9R4_9TELE|nr:hypothetical protein L3Q82_000410 [Scortum barcoo]
MVRSCGRKVSGACRGGNPRTRWWWTPEVRDAVRLKKESYRTMLACGTPDAVDDRCTWQAKQAAARTVLEAKTRVWEEFGGELLTSTGDIVGRWKKYFEDLLNPTDLPSNEEAEAGVSEVDSRPSPKPKSLRVLEGLWEFAQPVHMCFVDLEKAFDRVPRGILWGVLREYGVRGAFAKGCSVSVRPEQELGSHCRQISRRSQGPEGVRFGNHRISSLLFADDVVLMASSGQDLQHVLERFAAAECEAAGMRISTSKS